jgi:hypothetical protein
VDICNNLISHRNSEGFKVKSWPVWRHAWTSPLRLTWKIVINLPSRSFPSLNCFNWYERVRDTAEEFHQHHAQVCAHRKCILRRFLFPCSAETDEATRNGKRDAVTDLISVFCWNRRVAGSIPNGVLRFFNYLILPAALWP